MYMPLKTFFLTAFQFEFFIIFEYLASYSLLLLLVDVFASSFIIVSPSLALPLVDTIIYYILILNFDLYLSI